MTELTPEKTDEILTEMQLDEANLAAAISEENKRLTDEKTRLTDEKTRLTDEKTRLTDENTRLTDEKNRLMQENERLTAQTEAMKKLPCFSIQSKTQNDSFSAIRGIFRKK